MRIVSALFLNNFRDLLKTPTLLISLLMFPAIAVIMAMFLPVPEYGEENYLEGLTAGLLAASMFAPMFVAMGPINTASNSIAEDIEKKRLRFLIMAGVNAGHYLAAIILFVMATSIPPIIVFGLIAQLSVFGFSVFFGVMLVSTLAATVLGAMVGILSKSLQQAGSISIMAMMFFGFIPMFVPMMDIDALSNIAQFLFTYQLREVMFYELVDDVNLLRAIGIILANFAVFIALFAYVYRKRGLKGKLSEE
ncbi:MAG: ABC transporter permease [Firmicutes bacterium]|nr:ABC transporter permease [Bacillota bacterium]